MKKDLYIRALEYGHNTPEGFSYNDLTQTVSRNDNEKRILEKYFSFSYTNDAYRGEGISPARTPFQLLGAWSSDKKYNDNEVKYILTLEAKFKYIAYLELAEAMKNAKKATYIAIFSIAVSFIALVSSIVLSIVSINKPIRIADSQQKIVANIADKIDTLIVRTKPPVSKNKK